MRITDEEIKRICSQTIYKRGLEYYKNGRVHIKLRDNNTIGAVVDGEELYNVRIDFDGDKVKNSFCTCPYYQTMGSNCKHIVATLKKRQQELCDGETFKDDNDKLAQLLCKDFYSNCFEKRRLNTKFSLNITTDSQKECKFYISMKCGFDDLKEVDGIDRFFEYYLNGTDFKLSKHTAINSSEYSLNPTDEQIIEILCEAYENKQFSGMYTNRVSQTQIAPSTAKRLFPFLTSTDCEFFLNSMQLCDLRIEEDNPDILIDINATDSEISLNAFESGFSLFKDGSWFYYENTLYKTDTEWQSWFMPIYNRMISNARTQIDFKGSSKIDFATYVYPKLRNKQGVVTAGIDSILINEKPKFSVYLDYINNELTAIVKVQYGKMTIQIPQEVFSGEHIVIRDMNAENNVVSYFSSFNYSYGVFSLTDDNLIYSFIYHTLEEIKKVAKIYTSSSFDTLYKGKTIDIKTKVSYKNDVDLLEVDFESDLSAEEIYGILKAVRLGESFYKSSKSGFIRLNEEDYKNLSVFNELGFTEKDVRRKNKQISKYHLLYLDALSKENRLSSDKNFEELIDSIKNIKANIPKNLKSVLRNYQKDGVLWLKQLSELGFGGILADDMGLGKTLEVIAFVMGEKKELPALVVAPSALTYNWIKEIEKFAPDAKAKVIDGTKEERVSSLAEISGYDFIITSYPLIRRDLELFTNLEFSYMFIDEAQHIKNPDTMSAKSVKKIKAHRKFALSGTPIENSLKELWSIFDFTTKGYLSTYKDFYEMYEKRATGEENDTVLLTLQNKIKPFVLRRMKADVLSELPAKIENTIFAEFTPDQKKIYDAYRAIAKNEISQLFENSTNHIQILTVLLRLRQICCHPSLFDTAYKKDSAKLNLLNELVDSAISQGHRILIFSQFTSMLSIIKKSLNLSGRDCFFIDGKTPPSLRSELALRFNNGEKDIFLISLKAGGTGLNLVGADTVILYDPWWNPAVMEQASDRAYRIGQTKAVQIIKLATKGSIEEQILKLQENKKNLRDNVIRTNSNTISGFTKEEILSLFE